MSVIAQMQRFALNHTRPRNLTGAAAFRVLAGVITLYQFLINYAQRGYLFGPGGANPHEVFAADHPRALLALSTSPAFFEATYHLTILVFILWTLGVWSEILTPIALGLWYSFHLRFDILWDGGDNAFQLVLFYACFMRLSGPGSVSHEGRMRDLLRGLFHNFGLLAVALQLSIVYFVAGMTKANGETWRNGTALYHALNGAEFFLPGVSDVIYKNAFVVSALTQITVLFQVAFPFFLLLNVWTRRLIIVIGIAFHLGIGIVMGLTTFAGYMIAAELMLIHDDEYAWFFGGPRRIGARFTVYWNSLHRRTARLSTG